MISFFLGKHGYADVSGEEAAAEAKDIAGLNAVETYQCSEIQLIHAESFAKRTHVGEHLIHLPHLIFHGRIYQDANGQHHSDYGGPDYKAFGSRAQFFIENNHYLSTPFS